MKFFSKILPLILVSLIAFFFYSDLIAFQVIDQSTPTQFRVVWTEDPSHKASILWNAGIGKDQDNILYYDTEDHGDQIEKYQYQVKPLRITEYKKMNNALVRLKGLVPTTKYYFVVQNSFGHSKRLWFETAPDDHNHKISFITGGDSRNNSGPRRNANLLVSKLNTLFVLFGGDMTDNGSNAEWIRWMDDWQLTVSASGRVTPIVVVRGNHEASNQIHNVLFDMPMEGYYSLTLAQKLLKIYILNTEVSIGGNQTTWLLNELASNEENDFSVAIYHRPMRPHVTSKSEGLKQYEYWAKPFFNSGVDLVVESDSHTVKSTYPIIPTDDQDAQEGFKRDDQKGTVYVGEGCWGAPLRRANDLKIWTRSAGSFNQFKLVFVAPNKMELRTIMTDNAYDVRALSDEGDPFILPKDLHIWSPKEGAVIRFTKKRK